MKEKINFEAYYPKNFISLIIILAFLKKNSSENFKILFLNEQDFKKKFIKSFQKYLSNFFDKIKFINYSRRRVYNQKFLFTWYLARSNDVNKLCKKISINRKKYNLVKIYNGGDDFNFALYKIFKKYVPTYYLEHGFGPIRDGILPVSKKQFKNKLMSLVCKFFYNANIIDYYPIEYNGYISLLAHRIKCPVSINGNIIKKILVDPKEIRKIFLDFSKFNKINKFNKFIKNKKRYILLLTDSVYLSADTNKYKNLIFKISQIIGKNNIALFKSHPPSNSNIKFTKFNEFLKKDYKMKKLNYLTYVEVIYHTYQLNS